MALITRRRFVGGLAAGAGYLLVSPWVGPGLRGAAARSSVGPSGLPELSGTEFDLTMGPAPVNLTGRTRPATLVNGSLPGPLLRWREGDTVTIRVTNRLTEPTSIHWHGILLPPEMDGAPGVSFPGIAPDETFVYRFPVRQSGTYWYHSHTRFQEQTGLSGPLVIAPRAPDPVDSDRDHVVMLSDWTDEDPDEVYRHLKVAGGYYNYHRRTVNDFFTDAGDRGLAATLADRLRWGAMRMDPRDIADVSGDQTGGTYTYLMNGRPSAASWTGTFERGDRVRLRLINGSAMTYFDVRIPGQTMTVVAADGCNVHPVTVDEIRIGVAETYDVMVRPTTDACTIFAQAMDRSGYARGTLTTRTGIVAPGPSLDPIFERTMADMGMAMGGMADGAESDTTAMAMGAHGSGHGGRPRRGNEVHAPTGPAPANVAGEVAYPQPGDVRVRRGPAVASLARSPAYRLDDPGGGLRGNGRRVLTYADLARLDVGPQNAPRREKDPDAEVLLHLTGNMERYLWGFNGLTFSESDPVRFPYGQRVLVTLVNDTMMDHPIHLHGMFTELVGGHGASRPLKHTVSVKPGERLRYLVDATERGRWAYHCHLLYHMEAGMFTTAVVR